MKLSWRTLILTLALAGGTVLAQGGDYSVWHDTNYAFKADQILYAAEMDTTAAELNSPIKEQVIKDYYYQKSQSVKNKTIIAAPVVTQAAVLPETPRSVEASHITSTDPGAAVPAAKSAEPPTTPPSALPVKSPAALAEQDTVVTIPQAALDAKADIYVTAQILNYHVASYLVPAHTDWVSRDVTDYYYDHDGKPHAFTRTVDYPEYVPDTYVPHATVQARFNLYDTKTGKLVASSEDNRTRYGSDDLLGVYKRIVDRFFKNINAWDGEVPQKPQNNNK